MVAAAPILGRILDPLPSVLVLLAGYWFGCWVLALTGAPRGDLAALGRTPLDGRPLELVLTWLPPAGVFAAVFLKAAPRLPLLALVAVVGVSVVNGLTEEVFWRGAFVAAFPDRVRVAYLYPSSLFACWHVALALLPGVRYEGGVLALIGGAAVMGFGWGWVVWRTRDLRSVVIAHILTNTFAFSGLVLTNWVGPPTG